MARDHRDEDIERLNQQWETMSIDEKRVAINRLSTPSSPETRERLKLSRNWRAQSHAVSVVRRSSG